MAVQLDGKATERQRKYIGVLSSQGKEKLGKDFSIRKLASQKGINDWDAMSMEDANRLIKEVKAMLDDGFQVSEQDLINKLAKEKKAEEKPEASLAPASTLPFVLQVYPNQKKLQALQTVLQAMDIDFVVLQEVRA
jgi:hypothetical protein